MIVDVHTHVWSGPDQWGPQVAAELRRRFTTPMERADATNQAHNEAMVGVDVAFVLGFKSLRLGAEIPTPQIMNYVITAPERLIGFAGVDPLADGYLEALDSLSFRKMKGVVISPADQGFHPTHSRAMELYAKCQAMKVPVVVHQGADYARDSMLEYAQPYLLDAVARDFHDLKILITHCGHPWTDQALTLLGKHKNVYAELSGVTQRPRQLFDVLTMANHLEVTEKLLMGSDFPRQTPRQAISAIYSLNPISRGMAEDGVPREKLRAIVERDALLALGIERPKSLAEYTPPPHLPRFKRRREVNIP